MENNAINPSHYKQYPIETIEMMRRIWGNEATRMWCIMTAFKYRMRMGHKDDIEQDKQKEEWYLNYAANIPESKTAEDKVQAIKDAIDNICSYEAMFNTIKEIVL